MKLWVSFFLDFIFYLLKNSKSENVFSEKVLMFNEPNVINKKEYLKAFLNFKSKIIKEKKLF